MKNKFFETENTSSEFIDDYLLHIKIKEFKELQLSDYKEIKQWVKETIVDKKIVNLLEFNPGSSSSRESREYASSKNGNNLNIGAAIVVNNLGQQLIGDYYLKINKPLNPTKIFSNKEKALSWIKSQFGENIND